MSILQKNNKFLVLLIGLFAFFILIFFTKNFYNELQSNLDDNNTKKEKLENLDSKLDELNKLKIDLNDKTKEITKNLKKFTGDFSEDKLILYINNYIEETNKSSGEIVLFLDSISFSAEKKSELWFKEVSIDLRMKISDKNFLNNLLDYLTWDENKYSFFITDFSFPIEKSWPYKVNIPLKMYIK